MDINSFADKLNKAVDILNSNGVVGMPTETVYGLAAKIDSSVGIELIFKTKERPFFDPLIVHVSSVEQAKSLVEDWHDAVEILAQKFWPGPLTFILPKSEKINPMITSGLDSVGIRMPNHPIALELIRKANCPLAAPSANKFGKTSPTSYEHVSSEFGSEVFVLDGGSCQIGIESTVLLIKKAPLDKLGSKYLLSILRPGLITETLISEALRANSLSFEWVQNVTKKESPGSMKHHYMPSIPLIFVKNKNFEKDYILKLANQKINELPDVVEEVKIIKPKSGLNNPYFLNLSKDPLIASRLFYSELRDSSKSNYDCIICYQNYSENDEYWKGLHDRLIKAASIIFE